MRHDGGQGSIRMTDDEMFNIFSLKSKARAVRVGAVSRVGTCHVRYQHTEI